MGRLQVNLWSAIGHPYGSTFRLVGPKKGLQLELVHDLELDDSDEESADDGDVCVQNVEFYLVSFKTGQRSEITGISRMTIRPRL